MANTDNTNLAQLLYIDKKVKEIKYGLIQLTLRVDNEFIADVVVHKAERSLFKRKKDGNIEAKEELLEFDKTR